MAGAEATERDSPGSVPMGQQHPETDGAREPQTAGKTLIPKCIKEKKYTLAAAGVITALVITIIALAARKPESCQPCPPVDAACPNRWIGYQGKCYYVSGDRRNWTESETRCSAFGASLALIDNQLDLDFLINLTRPQNYWIGLSKEEGKAWRWINGTEFNDQFEVRGEGQCAYLNDNGISSTWCLTKKSFLCNQPDAYFSRRKRNLSQRDPTSVQKKAA